MEPPECPVCLQSYDSASTIPRVLACGHSTCQDCLAQLPRPVSPHIIRCPACTQLVKFPHPQGPSALPKNIDLLRFSDHESGKPSSPRAQKPTVPENRVFLPRAWSDELYSAWKDWILPEDVIYLENSVQKVSASCALRGWISSSDSLNLCLPSLLCRLKEDQLISLVKIGCCNMNESVLQYSYVAKVMSVLNGMSEAQRDELGFFLCLSMITCRVSPVYGLWFDQGKGNLYLVCEKKNENHCLQHYASKFQFSEQNGGEPGNAAMRDHLSCFAKISVELCEILLDLQSQGFVCGCLGVSCFCFDDFGHVHLDLSEVLMMGRKLRKCIAEASILKKELDEVDTQGLIADVSETDALVSPELLSELLQKEGFQFTDTSFTSAIDSCAADVWSLACVLLRLITGEQFVVEIFKNLNSLVLTKRGQDSDSDTYYMDWEAAISAMLQAPADVNITSFQHILCRCLDSDPGNRPLLKDLWKSIKDMCTEHCLDVPSTPPQMERTRYCLVLGELCSISAEVRNGSKMVSLQDGCDTEAGFNHKCVNLPGHLDCVTGLSVGGEFLFSSSFDKTIGVWSLQDLAHVHTFRGHEHKVMAVAFANEEKPLCISGDSEGGIFIWEVSLPFGQEPLKKWYEEKDWRYSGIHALAVSGGCIYTGSGDRLIKAWSLLDCTLSCTMEGHKSVVSTLVVSGAVLYSGSWDGTVRLWSLHDHSPLTVFGDHVSGTVPSVLSLYVDKCTVVAAHENGGIKIWMNDMPWGSTQVQKGAIFAVEMKDNMLITGGWDKTIKMQEIKGDELKIDVREVGSISCDSVITVMLYGQGKLFVGCANKLIKVYAHECSGADT